MHTSQRKNTLISYISAFSLAHLVSFLKVNLILGSFCATFSAVNVILPLTGLWCGMAGSTLVIGARLLFKVAMYKGTLPLSYLAFYVPGLCSAYYCATQSILFRFLLPLSCMVLFIMHPVGNQAWPYALYWLVPTSLYLFKKKSMPWDALGSTFVAHAVGSVIWIYTRESTPVLWMSLIPIVALERSLFAGGIIVCHRVTHYTIQKLKGFIPLLRTA